MKRDLAAKTEILLIVLLASIPLFIHLPYRVNIFLSWEGAYRISQGQLPFRDFGIPLGGMYWAVPAVFFKLFGAKLVTLIKAQVFMNIVAGLSFRSILRSLNVNKGLRLARPARSDKLSEWKVGWWESGKVGEEASAPWFWF